jgi:hypothetical protein
MLNDRTGHEKDWSLGNKTWGRDDAEKLRRLVSALQTAIANPDPLRPLMYRMGLNVADAGELNRAIESWRCTALPDLRVELKDDPGRPAAFRFLRLVLRSSPHTLALLGGPCKYSKCGKWFARKTARPSVYCSKVCTINGQKEEERTAARKEMVDRVSRAILNYEELSPASRYRRRGWRAYVIDAADISPKFLTQLLRNGEVVAPGESSSAKPKGK